MATLPEDLADRIKSLSTSWTAATAIGSFALYVAGYLALRFHLLVFGIAADLSVLDERYLFAGAQFLAYLVAALPSIALLLAPPLALGWLASRLLPRRWRASVVRRCLRPGFLLAIGLLVAVGTIQFAMRLSFVLQDLLLASRLPDHPAWLREVLLNPEGKPLYFDALVAACLLPTAMLARLRRFPATRRGVAIGRPLLAAMVAIQWLLLPINFGVLIVDQTLPRVLAAGPRAAAPGDVAWLAWEGQTALTFLVCNADGRRRSLFVVPRDKAGPIEIVASDPIFPTLFSPGGARRVPLVLEQP